MDLVSEKMTSLLPEPSNIEAVSMDTTIPNPLPNMDKHTFHTITLGEGTIFICENFMDWSLGPWVNRID